MSSTKIIRKRVCLEPELLDKNYEDSLYDKIKNLHKEECSKEHGYFLEIKRIVNIVDNNISSSSEIVFIVEFEAETLLPEKGKEFEGVICMIFNGGVFVIVKNKLKVLIPVSELINYSYNTTDNTFYFKDKILKKGDTIDISILDMKYSKKQFSCFGKII
jgi:DNA-directed RNA polymerase subunit E'/Rpb7